MKKTLALAFFIVTLFSFGFSRQVTLLGFSKTGGYRHKNIPAAMGMLNKLANKNGWTIDFTEDSTVFNDADNVKKYDALVFISVTGNILDAVQQSVLVKYIENGGGLLTLHTGTDFEKAWEWHEYALGATFKGHPKPQSATFYLQDSLHPATFFLPRSWAAFEEIYNFEKPVSEKVKVLVSVDEASYLGGSMNGSHPMVWTNLIKKGRIFQSALGHFPEFYEDDKMVRMTEAAIKWVIKK